MSYQNDLVLTGIIVIAGKWAQKQELTAKVAVGAIIVILFLTMIANVDEDLADAFGLAILVTSLFRYMIPIGQHLGFVPVGKEGK